LCFLPWQITAHRVRRPARHKALRRLTVAGFAPVGAFPGAVIRADGKYKRKTKGRNAMSTLYKTARATMACAKFNVGDYVAITYDWTDENGVMWWLVTATQDGQLDTPVAYRSEWLSDFCL
jgi:hypothetical protein